VVIGCDAALFGFDGIFDGIIEALAQPEHNGW
jgi:hypothetical protein